MKELKFRAWLTKEKVMSRPFTLGETTIYSKENKPLCGFQDKDLIIMQYVGLKDRNGKEIYEGDIVRVKCIWEKGKIEEYIGVIVFEDFAFGVKLKKVVKLPKGYYCEEIDGQPYYLLHWDEIEVIGNVYENPELLR